MNERSIFAAALDIADAAERAQYLDRACGNDAALRRQVDRLLVAQGELGSFLDQPPPGIDKAITDAPITEKPGAEIGPYKLLEQIGEGGMGLVFHADQLRPVRRRVALKIIKPGMDSKQVIARFEAERQALALMDHPNIARVLDAGATESGRPYFVMELVRGIPITEYCDHHKLTIRQRLELFMRVCNAVQHAHQKGIIHRDLKPTNVLVAHDDTVPVPKVIDFGVAKATGQSLTERSLFTGIAQMLGTPRYMSPEQAALNLLDVDTRSDIYSLGVLLYELLTGTTPFEEARMKTMGLDEVRRIIQEEEPPHPSTRVSTLGATLTTTAERRGVDPRRMSVELRGDLDWIVMKALDKDRNRRYETANSFALDVGRYLANEPVEACPPSVGYRMRKFARRNKGALATAAAFALLLLTGGLTGLLWYQSVQIDRATEIARQDARKQGVERDISLALDEAATIPADVHRKLADPVLFADLLSDIDGWKTTLDRARAVWKRADTLAAANRDVLEPALSAHVQARGEELDADESDWRLAKELDDIRLVASTAGDGGKITPYQNFYQKADQDYYEFFVRQGLLYNAERISGERLRFVLVAALDNWLPITEPVKVWQFKLKSAWMADPDRWRDQVRNTNNLRNKETVAKLAQEVDFFRQSPHILSLLGLKLEKSEERAAFLRKALVAHPKDFWLNYDLGSSTNDLGEKMGCFRAALVVRPNSCLVYHSLGMALAAKKDLDGAIGCFEKTISLDATYSSAYYNLGNVLKAKGDPNGAARNYEKAINLANFAQAHCNLGNILADDKENLRKAMRHYDKAIEIQPKLAEAYNGRGNIFWDKNDLKGAIRNFEKAADLDYAPPCFNLATLLKDKGDYKGAIRYYEKGIKLAPTDARAHAYLGNTLARTRDVEGAIRQFKIALDIDPKLGEAHWQLAGMLVIKGELEMAVRHLDEALRCNRNDPDAHFTLATVYCLQGNFAKALKYEKISRKLGSKVPGWTSHSPQWVKMCEQALAQDQKLAAILEGKSQAVGYKEMQTLADQCRIFKHYYAAAATFYADALTANPDLADKENDVRLYAAICAAKAAAGQGKDANKLDDATKAKLRRQALDCLRADVAHCENTLASIRSDKDALLILTTAAKVSNWQTDPALAGVRDEKELAQMSVEEQKSWRQFWTDASQMAKKTRAAFTELPPKKGTLSDQKREETHVMKLQAGQVIIIDMESFKFDTYLRLEDDKGNLLDKNDDISDENQNSRLVFIAPQNGTYQIVATSFGQRGQGAYTLTIRQFKRAMTLPKQPDGREKRPND